MLIIGCDYHPGFQQIAFLNTDGGELGERRLAHREEAEQFYGKLKEQNLCVRVGMEASGHARWFERLLRRVTFRDAQDRPQRALEQLDRADETCREYERVVDTK